MSKSKGNGVDPLELVDKYGADAVRFTIASIAGETQDVRLPVGYECPHCGTVIPQTLEHQKAIPGGGAKPRVTCTKCKKSSQYTTPGSSRTQAKKSPALWRNASSTVGTSATSSGTPAGSRC